MTSRTEPRFRVGQVVRLAKSRPTDPLRLVQIKEDLGDGWFTVDLDGLTCPVKVGRLRALTARERGPKPQRKAVKRGK